MNILLVNHYAGSLRHGMEYRPFYLAREWVRAGHRVTIVAASCSHVRQHPPAINAEVTVEEIEGIRYLWLDTPPYQGNGAARARNMFAFVQRLYQHRERLLCEARPDVVIASSTYPLDNYPVRALARRAGATMVYEVHDLWPLSPVELGGMSPLHPFMLLLQHAENYGYRHADRVVSMLPNARSHMERHGMAPRKFAYVPNGVDVEEWASAPQELPEEHRAAIAALRREGRFLVAYAGAHGVANALSTFLEAGASLRGEPVTLLLVGQGPEKDALQEQAASAGLENVCFLPPVAKPSIPALLAGMDALYIGLQRTSLFRFGISPNKLMDYMMAGKPVIQAVEAGNDMVSESGCGISIRPEDAQSVADAVRGLLSLSAEERTMMGARGREYVLTHHDYRVLAGQFLAAVS